MALVKCRDCRKDYSDLAKSCPNCGRPRNPKSKGYFAKEVIGAVVIVLLAATLFGGLGFLGAVILVGIYLAVIANR